MTPRIVDFDLHGLVGIRVLDADEQETNGIRRQLGPIERPLDREPDLIVRFVDAVAPSATVHAVGPNESGFANDEFLVLQGRMKALVRVAVPFDRIGEPGAEVLCQRGTLGIPFLIALVNLCALSNGILPLHATAFVHRGTGVLVTGWAKGGKTETLLAFMAQGAQYVGDEWIYIDPASRRMWGIPEPMRLWDWHLASMPRYAQRVHTSTMVRLRALRIVIATMSAAATGPIPSSARRLLTRALPIARRQLSVQLRPDELFGPDARLDSATIERLVLVGVHDAPQIEARPSSAGEIGARVISSLNYERRELVAMYQQFRFAFPGRRNRILERIDELQDALLQQALADVPAFELVHPLPVHIPALFNALDQVLEC